jgi:hypothetical protein
MKKETIYKGKIQLDHQSLKITIDTGLDDAGATRYYVVTAKQESIELVHNPDTHQWEQLKTGATRLSRICGSIIEAYYF